MSDILIQWDAPNGRGVWALNAAGNDLALGPTLESAVYLSLFTDRRAADDDVIPDGTANRRGHWTDTGATSPIGSRLWLLARAKQTADTLHKAHDYIVEALQWMIDDGLVASVAVTTEWSRPSMLGARVILSQADGTVTTLNYSWAWTELS